MTMLPIKALFALGRSSQLPLLTIMIGVAVSVIIANLVQNAEVRLNEQEFNRQASAMANTIQGGIDRNIEVLEAMSAFFAHSGGAAREEFRGFAGKLLQHRHGDIQALEWIPHVPYEKRAEYEGKARSEGIPEFRFTERVVQGKMVTAGIRPEYFPVYFVEPLKGNETAVGFDLASNPARREAIEASRVSGEMVATTRIILVQETGEQYGFLIFQPVYRNSAQPNQTGRGDFLGFALGVFRIGDMVEYALRNSMRPSVSISLSDLAAPQEEQMLYRSSPAPAGSGGEALYRADFPLQMPGRQWTIHLESTPAFESSHPVRLSWGILFAGLLISVLLSAYLRTLILRNQEQQLLVTAVNKSNLQLEQEIVERRHAEVALTESEHRFRTLFEASPDGIVMIGPDGNILMCNPRAVITLGYERPEELLGRDAMGMVAPEDRPRAAVDIQSVAKGGAVKEEYWFIRKDGSRIPVEITGSMLADAEDKPKGVVGIIRDITERKRMVNELREIGERFRHLVETTSDWVWQVDEHGIYIYASHKVRDILGYEPEEVYGKSPFDLMPAAEAKRVAVIFGEIAKAKTSFSFLENINLHKDGHEVILETSGVPVLDAEGNIRGYFGVDRDITRRKQAEDKIRKLNDELEIRIQERTRELQEAQEELVRKEKQVLLGKIAANVAHELRNPIGVMSNAVYFLQTVLAGADDSVKEYLNIIKHEIAGSERIVSDLLDAVRTKLPNTEIVGVRELLEQMLYKLDIPSNVTVKLDIPGTIPRMRVDVQQIQQVFRNIITNGVEAMSDGGTLEIGANADEAEKSITFSVRDSGSGIAAEILPNLFQPLFTTKARGIGLGLVVVKNLTEANGGTVKVESEAGRGTVFTVTLPMDIQVDGVTQNG